MRPALTTGMKAKRLEDLQIYQKALEGIEAVSPLLRQLTVRRDCTLHDQLAESSGNIPGHIAEGFGQLTDRHFAHYLGIARGSAQETRGHLAAAARKEHISPEDASRVSEIYLALGAMLTAFIKHLRDSDFRDRW
jgi:four helix bundle protein